MAGKKDKTKIAKRRRKAKQQKVKKRKLMLIKWNRGAALRKCVICESSSYEQENKAGTSLNNSITNFPPL